MAGLALDKAHLVLEQAARLREEVRDNLRAGGYQNDDVQMQVYNDLALTALSLFPDDPMLSELERMPDALLRSQGLFGSVGTPDQPSKRLESHLTRLVNRLQMILGEREPEASSTSAAKVLQAERRGAVGSILEDLEQLLRRQPELPLIDSLPFDFIADIRLRQALSADFVEAQRAYTVGAFKASSLLAGGLVEGMLLDVCQWPTGSIHQASEMVGTESREGRCLLERNKPLFFQQPLGLTFKDETF